MKNILLIALLMLFKSSFACECKTFPITDKKTQDELFLEDSFKNATIIFYAKYIGKGKFQKIKFYRGKKLVKTPYSIQEKEEKTTCDDYFERDKYYLIFGRVDNFGKLWTSICYANTLIENRKQLKFIKKYLKNNSYFSSERSK